MARARARKLPAAERSEGILGAAIKVFSSKGYYGTATREIAEAAGVSEPTVFQYYKTKKDLFLAAISAAAMPFLAFWQETAEGPKDPVTKLQALGFDFVDRMLNEPSKARLLLTAIATIGDPDIEGFVRAGQDAFHAIVAGILQDGMARAVFRDDLDVSNEAWRFQGLGFAMCTLLLLEKAEELRSDNIWRWGDAFRDSILKRDDG